MSELQEERSYDVYSGIKKLKFRDFWMVPVFLFNFGFSLFQVNYVVRRCLSLSNYREVFSKFYGDWNMFLSTIVSRDMFVMLGLNLIVCFLLLSLFVLVLVSVPKEFIRVSGLILVLTSILECYKTASSGREYAVAKSIFRLIHIPLIVYTLQRSWYAADLFKHSTFLVKRFLSISFMGIILFVILVSYSVAMWIGVSGFAILSYSYQQRGTILLLFPYLLFSFYWTYSVILNVMRLVASGFVCSFILCPRDYNYSNVVTRSHVKQALIYNFGSICLAPILGLLCMPLGGFAMVEMSMTGDSYFNCRRRSNASLEQKNASKMLGKGRIFLHSLMLGCFEITVAVVIATFLSNVSGCSIPTPYWVYSAWILNFCLIRIFFAAIRSAMCASIYVFNMKPGNLESVAPRLYQRYMSTGISHYGSEKAMEIEYPFETAA